MISLIPCAPGRSLYLPATRTIALILAFGAFFAEPSGDVQPATLLHQMFDSIRTVRTLRMRVKAIERVEGKYMSGLSEVRLQTHPRKLYYRNIDKKVEVLYNESVNAQKALVKPNVFPYMSLWLDPTGALMRKNQHYTINELGFEFIGKSIALTIAKDEHGVSNFTYHGRVPRNGCYCYLLEYESGDYAYVSYRVGERETASSIAFRLCVNDYLLRQSNGLVNEFGFLKPGTVLKVPTLYCKRAVIYIDERTMLPVSVSVYDDRGLFESYDYTGIELNPPFTPGEFMRSFGDYGF